MAPKCWLGWYMLQSIKAHVCSCKKRISKPVGNMVATSNISHCVHSWHLQRNGHMRACSCFWGAVLVIPTQALIDSRPSHIFSFCPEFLKFLPNNSRMKGMLDSNSEYLHLQKGKNVATLLWYFIPKVTLCYTEHILSTFGCICLLKQSLTQARVDSTSNNPSRLKWYPGHKRAK